MLNRSAWAVLQKPGGFRGLSLGRHQVVIDTKGLGVKYSLKLESLVTRNGVLTEGVVGIENKYSEIK